MLRQLLVDRFKLSSRLKTRTIPAYVLFRGKEPLKLHASDGRNGDATDAGGAALINAGNITVEEFAQLLSAPLKSPVVDMTGLKGLYDFKLDIFPYLQMDESGGVDDRKLDITGILSQAVQDQLGLKLQLRKAPVVTLMVDRIQSPSGN